MYLCNTLYNVNDHANLTKVIILQNYYSDIDILGLIMLLEAVVQFEIHGSPVTCKILITLMNMAKVTEIAP